MGYSESDLSRAVNLVVSRHSDVRLESQDGFHVCIEYKSNSGKKVFPAYYTFDGVDPYPIDIGGTIGPWENRSLTPSRIAREISELL